jgi:hypothetical protein
MESAAISARTVPDRPTCATKELIEMIFSSLVAMEDTLTKGRELLKDLSDPINRIDDQGPIYPPSTASDAASGAKVDREPSLIDKLNRISERIDELRSLAQNNNQIAEAAICRLNAVV